MSQRKMIIVMRRFSRSSCNPVILKSEFDSVVKNKLDSSEIKHKKHPGIRSVKLVRLSDRLYEAASNFLSPYSVRQLREPAEKLLNSLWSRHLPMEKKDYELLLHKKTLVMAAKKRFDLINVSPDDAQEFVTKHDPKIKRNVETVANMWKAVDFDMFHGSLYVFSCMAPNFASLKFILNELVMSDSSFRPSTVFSFGSGVGTDIWAVNSFWPDCVDEYFCVDTSSSMNKIANSLLQGGGEDGESFLKGVYFRQFLPASHDRTFDLVISSSSLLELPSGESRIQVVDNLWQKTNKYLLIVEPGTNAGYCAILEARDYILKLSKNSDMPISAYVHAPCPHDYQCPRFSDTTKTPCNFEVRYVPFDFLRSERIKSYRFSYVLLKKGTKSVEANWPRIVREVKNRKNHTWCQLCCADGKLRNAVFTKNRHGYDLYKCSRYCNWGDKLPVNYIQEDENDRHFEEDDRETQ